MICDECDYEMSAVGIHADGDTATTTYQCPCCGNEFEEFMDLEGMGIIEAEEFASDWCSCENW